MTAFTITGSRLAELWSIVLEVPAASLRPEHDFMALGGYSLLMADLQARIKRSFGCVVSLRDLFEHSTLAAMTELLDSDQYATGGASDTPAATPDAPPVAESVAELSADQERIRFADGLTDGSPTYNVPFVLRVPGRLDEAALRRAMHIIVARHEILRTTYPIIDGRAIQVVHPPQELPLPAVDRADLSTMELEAEARRPFDLATGPIVRCTLYRTTEGDAFMIVMHHIASDATSLTLLMRELTEAYAAVREGRDPVLPTIPLQYREVAARQREATETEKHRRDLDYWAARLAGITPLELPLDRPRPPVQTYRGGHAHGRIAPEVVARVRTVARAHRVTDFMVVLAGLKAMLWRYSGLSDVAVASITSTRHQWDCEHLLGLFVNTLVLRTEVTPELTFPELISRVRDTSLSAYEHQDAPFDEVVRRVNPPRDPSRVPLATVAVSWQIGELEAPTFDGVKATVSEYPTATAKFDMEFFLTANGDAIDITIEYNRDLYDQATADRLVSALESMLTHALEAADQPLSRISPLSAAERRTLLVDYQPVRTWRDSLVGVHHLVERQVDRTPDLVAVEFHGETLTYRELEERANQLAHFLGELGVGLDSRVAVSLERTPLLAIALLGIFKAGGCYVPLDPDYPQERLRMMIDDSDAIVVLTEQGLANRAPSTGQRVISLDTEWEAIAKHPIDRPGHAMHPEAIAYVMYTSGSTGRPKGVVVQHAVLTNLMRWRTGVSELGVGSRTLQLAPLSFDLSFHDIFSTLISGGTIVMVPPHVRQDPNAIVEFMAAHDIHRFFHLFTAAHNVAAVPDSSRLLRTIREITSVGEQFQSTAEIRRLVDNLDGCVIWNEYGPTETHVATAYALRGPASAWAVRPPIGTPILNARAYVLGPDLELLPIGAEGELYLAGVCVAREYLGRPDLTAERFLPDPFAVEPGTRMYRTGDRCRWTSDGQLVYFGRTDHQIKVRGKRVEPAEVEEELGQHPAVGQVVVVGLPDADGNVRLVAYVCPVGPPPSQVELRDFLKARLPDHLVPPVIMMLDSLPVTPSGKVDRKALPLPAADARALSYSDFRAAESQIEREVARVWQTVLNLDHLGVDDSFFDVGGDSLLIVKLHAMLRDELGSPLSIVDLFVHHTIAAQARALADREETQEDSTAVVNRLAGRRTALGGVG
ncbi:amino acid adenylation domain-containing protein [Nonomuraea sp. K274]|uniref:Amino acid adenylation domain-containing protein n=1 Tax=Nonomuraea cypriaca TaxID=1187855 RepID=A0A931A661_9ACTN|nr:non-ribosomal peptide synthetase [Nonomuraea cypriaca]MBF8187062.1 amino acid adenylation domain-containing protein [Nonomuraea cypriaca]